MADYFVTRQNFITADKQVRTQFLEGVKILKNTPSGKSTKDFNIPALNGVDSPVSRYDLFVIWHFQAMNRYLPPDKPQQERGAAHMSPLFLPWHRIMLLAFEYNLQVALGDARFALPYWDWAADASMQDPKQSKLWSDTSDYLGTGPGGGLYYDTRAGGLQYSVKLYENPDETPPVLRQIPPRGLQRELGQQRQLPNTTAVEAAATAAGFDTPPYSHHSTSGFRHNLEVNLHNDVHVWVGGHRGDMGPSSSPNDPVFFLHHCNVDRIWEAWMQTDLVGTGQGTHRVYHPTMSETDYVGLRIFEVLPVSPGNIQIASTLDMTNVYRYDNFDNTGNKPANPVIGRPRGGSAG
jgi:tyrosinase